MLSNLTPPFDDSVQLSEMQIDVSDEQPIVEAQSQPDMEEPAIMMSTSGKVISKRKGYAIVAILFFVNLLNYMDRFTIAGLLF